MNRSGTTRAYFPELDGFRFVAFLLVFGFHGGYPWLAEAITLVSLPVFLVAIPMGSVAQGWVAGWGPGVGRAVSQNGWVGVQAFFVLSGFLITTLLLREERETGRVDLRAFWIRRMLRIWPLYFLTLGLTFLALPRLDGRWGNPGFRAMAATHLPWFLAFLGNASMIRHGPVGDDAVSILWSVCVEEQFYVVVPLLVAWVGSRWRLTIVAIGSVVSVAIRAWLASGQPDQWVIQYNTFAQADTLLAGVGLALWIDAHPKGAPMPRWSGPVSILGVAWLLAQQGLAHTFPGRRVWGFIPIWVVAAMVIAWLISADSRLRGLLSSKLFVGLGRISFGLYMYHEMALTWLGRTYLGSLAAFVMTVALAWISYHGFERPFLRLKRRWTMVESRPT